MTWPFQSARDRLGDEAAEWLVKMRGPERERHRSGFERWYRSSPAHAEAFNEATAGFQDAGVLRLGELGRARNLPESRGMAVPRRFAIVAGAAAAIIALIFLGSAYMPSPTAGAESVVRYATADQMQEFGLPDGSRMTLAQDSVALVAFIKGERRITLEQGRGRFAVAREHRPFRVAAGKAEVLAHGTIFDVSLSAGQTRVVLIEGSVDVSYSAALGPATRSVHRMKPGDQLILESQTPAPAAKSAQRRAAREPVLPQVPGPAMLQFDSTPLKKAIAEANRYSHKQIRLADQSIGELKITGAFRSGDTEAFAESLSEAFGLHLERQTDATLILHANRRPDPAI
jgi:transmembrane sensor